MEQTKIFTALEACAGGSRWTSKRLEQVLVRFSRLVAEQRWIKEIDINPLLASPERLIALDARIVLHPPETREEDLAAAGHSSLSGAIRETLDAPGNPHPSHPPGRRAA